VRDMVNAVLKEAPARAGAAGRAGGP
jgi:hypothetical protein